jgi:hypothetical protein
MDARASYFRFMEDVMYELMCINIMREKFVKIDIWTRIFLAVFSSAGVASWFVWEEYAQYAAVAIAISQIVSIAMPFFEWRKKIEKLMIASTEMQELADQIEDQWPQVKSTLLDAEISEMIATLRARQRKYLERLAEVGRPNENIRRKAEARLNEYGKLHFYE